MLVMAALAAPADRVYGVQSGSFDDDVSVRFESLFGGGGRINPSASRGGEGITNPLTGVNSLPDLIQRILDALIQLAIPVAVLFIVYAGFLFVTARGDEKKLETAKATLLYTVIGIAILVGASFIASVVQNTVGLLK